MSDQFIGEIRLFPYNFAPARWAMCQGQLLPISQNTALFSLLGTNYGGNGTSTFGLPDLRGRVPIHWGAGPGLSPINIGEVAGAPSVTLQTAEVPPHSHTMAALAHNATRTGHRCLPGGGTRSGPRQLQSEILRTLGHPDNAGAPDRSTCRRWAGA